MARIRKSPIKPAGPLVARATALYPQNVLDIPKKVQRAPSGVKALYQMRYMQRTTMKLIPKAVMSRLVHELARDIAGFKIRIRVQAMDAFHEAAEAYIVDVFKASIKAAIHAKRVSIEPKDLHFARDCMM
jgi:histone H3/H4